MADSRGKESVSVSACPACQTPGCPAWGEQSEVILDNGGCSPVDSAVGAMQRHQGSVGRLHHFLQACAARDDGAAVLHRDGQDGLDNTAVVVS